MARITTATLDTRITALDARLDELITAVYNLMVASPAHKAKPAPAPKAPKAPTAWTLMGEENLAMGRMATARYTCTTPGCTNTTGFYKLESAAKHKDGAHTYEEIVFNCLFD
jgi:hypothetical protein